MTVMGEKIIGTTREIVAEAPGFVYDSDGKECLYVERDEYDNATPGCIFGHVLWRLGIIDGLFITHESNTDGIRVLAWQRNWELSGIELNWMAKVQNAQDTGSTWAEAVGYADRLFKVA